MSAAITIRDETAAGRALNEWTLEIPSERITVRELIRERVYQEVQDFNRRPDDRLFRGLVQPTDAEPAANGGGVEYRLKPERPIDWKSQFELALEAFVRHEFLILVNNSQAEHLDQEFGAGPGTLVTFVKLTLLVGG